MKNIISRADVEFEQSVIRILLGSVVILYLLLFTPYQSWMPIGFGGFILISTILSIYIKRNPGTCWWRILLGQVIDFGAISINIYSCGELALPVLGVYLWVIIGNGCRFGLPYLLSAITISTIFFSIVALHEPFLKKHPYLSIGIGISQLFVPFYFAILLKRLNETRDRLEFLSEFDELTALLNRRKFDRQIRGEFQRLKRSPAPFSLALIDIDHFKAINDNLGHLAGDEVLRSVAQNIKNSCRSTDSVARYGGEEFAVLLPGLTDSESLALSERIRENIAHEVVCVDKESLHVTVSVGVTCWSDTFEKVEDWIMAADKSLYAAKSKGRNRVVITDKTENNSGPDHPLLQNLSSAQQS